MRTTTLYNGCQAVLLFLIIFFLSAILSSRVVQKGEMVSVPDLTGKTLAEARAEVSRKHLSLQEDGEAFNDRWERGRIILQEPPAGSKVRTNKVIKVMTSAGSEMVSVPELVGRSLEAAVKILAELGLQRGKISHIHTPRYAAGRIIAQAPLPSPQKIKRTTPIHFLVSQGESEPKYVMPDLIGKRALPAINRLGNLGFKVADIRYAYYPGIGAGIIIKQFPAHGYVVARRNLITLEVSR